MKEISMEGSLGHILDDKALDTLFREARSHEVFAPVAKKRGT